MPTRPAYESKVHSAEPIFKLIARSATGRSLLERFLPLYRKGKVKIEPYPPAIVAKLREVIPEGFPVGACLVTEGDQGTIFLDFESPLGVLAPFLVHEISHALEPRIKTEAEAFQIQYRFTQELRERDTEYDSFLKAHYPKAKILHQLLDFEAVEELYGKRSA